MGTHVKKKETESVRRLKECMLGMLKEKPE
jgi:hypothetical protein